MYEKYLDNCGLRDAANKKGIDPKVQTLNELKTYLAVMEDVYIEIQIDHTTAPKFCFEVWKYEDFGNWSRLDVREKFFLYLTEEKCLIDALKISLNSLPDAR